MDRFLLRYGWLAELIWAQGIFFNFLGHLLKHFTENMEDEGRARGELSHRRRTIERVCLSLIDGSTIRGSNQ
jgi:hypothetical protein